MRLKSITLKNFQAHKGKTIEFSLTITTIVGATDKGKSSILRALRWACLNDFSGAEFVREGEKSTTVILRTDNHKIVRTKSREGGATNLYKLDGAVFKSFGQKVPTEIEKVLPLSEINFQGQHDAPFWFNETAGEVSRKLNSVIDLSVIDTTLSNISNEVRRAQGAKDLLEEKLKTVSEQYSEACSQKIRIKQFKNLKGLNESYNQILEDHYRLEGLVARIDSNPSRPLAAKAAALEGVVREAKEAFTLARRFEDFTNLIESVEQCEKDSAPVPSFSPVLRARAKVAAYEISWEDLRDLIVNINIKQSEKHDWVECHRRSTATLAIQTKGKICPLCQKRIR